VAETDVVGVDLKIPPRTIMRVQNQLAGLPKEVQTKLAKDLRKELVGPAANIVSDFPKKAPMSGMTGRWGFVKSTIRTFPNSRPGRAIALIGVAGENRGFNRLVAITERAGSRSAGLTRSGKQMIKTLQQPDRFPLVGKGGRFIWKSWLKHRPTAIRGALSILNDFVTQYNRRFR